MDPLSDVLALLKTRTHHFRELDAGGDWSIQWPELDGIKCYAIVSGACWLAVDGVRDPVRFAAGDCVLLPLRRRFRMASDLALPPLDAVTVFSAPANGGVATVNGGGGVSGVGGSFRLSGHAADMLVGVLPAIVHVRRESDRAALRWFMDRMRDELRGQRPGGALALEHLAHMLLVEALRVHLAEGPRGNAGWLSALADRQVGPAINAMHAVPEQRWTVQTLAELVGMSRSSFALRFKATVGSSPMDYLTRWRMLLAGDALENSGEAVSTISLRLGYESEAAFSTAFKRVMGCPPRRYCRGADTSSAAPASIDASREGSQRV